ncbi:MAG TPA: hypothetical protein VF780_00300 [Nitrosospira sp.]
MTVRSFETFRGRKTRASLRYTAARFLLAGAISLCAACVSQPQTGVSGWDSGPARSGPAAETAPAQTLPGQAETASGQSSAPLGRRWCGPPIPPHEDFLDKIVRILFMPDWCGPDADVDTNISAGGAAGG